MSQRGLCSRGPNSGVVTSTGRDWHIGFDNGAELWKDRRNSEQSTIPMRIIMHMLILSNPEDNDGIDGLASTVQIQALGGGLWEATDINNWGKFFGLGRDHESPANHLMTYLHKMLFCQLNTSDGFYEKDKIKKNALMLLPTYKVVLQHSPQYSHELKKNVLIHENMLEEEADAIRLISHSGIQEEYEKKNQIQYKVTIKSKNEKKRVEKVKSATKVAKIVNGGKPHTAFQMYLHSNVYQRFAESIGDSSRMPVVLRWPMAGRPSDYVNQQAELKKALPRMKTDYYKIECFIPGA